MDAYYSHNAQGCVFTRLSSRCKHQGSTPVIGTQCHWKPFSAES